MYTFYLRKSLISNNAKAGIRNDAYPRFSLHKDNTFFPVFQTPVNVYWELGLGYLSR